MSSKIGDIVHASQEALARRDIEAYLALFADDLVGHDVRGHFQGKDHLRHHVEGLLGLFVEFGFRERKVYTNGRTVAMRFTIEAKTQAGGAVVVEGVDVFEFDDQDRIRKVTSFYDPSAVGGG